MWFTHKSFICVLLVGFLALTGLPSSCYAMSIKDEMQLNEKQQESFDNFKAKAIEVQMPKYMKNEIVLIKYFRYADLDENKAIEVLKENLKWRLDWGFEKLSEDDINEHSRTYPFSTFTDKRGRGVFYLPTRYWDCSIATTTPESTRKFTNFAYHILEEAFVKGVSNITGKKESGIVLIEDMHAAEVSKAMNTPCIKLVKEISLDLDLRWPLATQGIYLLNVDALIHPPLNILRSALPEKMKSVTYVYDENDAIWLPELQKFIPEDKFPAELYVKSRQQPAGQMGGAGPSVVGGMGMFFGGNVPAPAPERVANPEGRSIKKGKKKKKKGKKNDDDGEDDDEGLD